MAAIFALIMASGCDPIPMRTSFTGWTMAKARPLRWNCSGQDTADSQLGRNIEVPTCTRERLDKDQVRYLDRVERRTMSARNGRRWPTDANDALQRSIGSTSTQEAAWSGPRMGPECIPPLIFEIASRASWRKGIPLQPGEPMYMARFMINSVRERRHAPRRLRRGAPTATPTARQRERIT